MIQISRPDFVVFSALGQQQKTDGQYRWSKYILRKTVSDGMLCYNTLTCELVHIPSEEMADSMQDKGLIEKWFLVPEQYDEYQLAEKAKKLRQLVYRSEAKRKANVSIDGFWILTTTNCNAACYYCHERGIPKLHMDAETALDTVRYIEANCKSKRPHIMWYGGEPLVNSIIIDLISRELDQRGFDYSSSMISNGYAFDEAMVAKAKSLWHLNEVQITLDGKEETYNRVKAFRVSENENPFRRVLKNIELLLKYEIKVHVRLNIDTYNQSELFDLADNIIQRFGASNSFFVYSAPLLEECLGTSYKREDQQRKEVYQAHFDLREKLETAGVLLKTDLPKGLRSEMRCIAVSNVRVIFPDGKLAFCHDYSDGILSGDIFGNEPTKEERLKYTVPLPSMKKCKDCAKFPQCIRFERCFKNQCNDELIEEWIRCTEQEMAWEYEKYLKKENNLQNNGGCFLEIH